MAKPQVISLLKSNADASVRIAAIGALGDIGDSTDLPQLMTFLKDESSETQSAAKKSLAHLRHASVNSLLVDAMKNGNAASQTSIIEVLVARRATPRCSKIQWVRSRWDRAVILPPAACTPAGPRARS